MIESHCISSGRAAPGGRAIGRAGSAAGCFGLCLGLLLAAAGARADVPTDARRGAELYKDSSYKEAADAFRQATIASPDDLRWRYDLGLSEAKGEDFESALNNLETTAGQAEPRIAGAAHYNAGNVHYAMGDFAAAAKSYREALVRRPDDADAKRNLELALKQLLLQQQQQQKQEQKPDSSSNEENKDKDQKNKDEQSSPDSDKQKEQQQPDSQQNPDEAQNDSLQNQTPRPDSSVTREQAERILKALADEEARLRDEAKGMKVLPAPGGKDW